uniref:Uncharacterized protein n=1 Tax=viral metagenome TaxID=1070528 RepID=A0A6C0AKJ1_9ZZZZ
MDVVLLMGLAALGYAMAVPRRRKGDPTPDEAVGKELYTPLEEMEMSIVQAATGHNNMVPFFGANRTQTTYSDGHESLLDKYTGMGKNTFFRKEEAAAFFEPEAGRGNPWKAQVETDFEQSRQVTSMAMKNVAPIDRVIVGRGVNDGYTNLPSGGLNQGIESREFQLPKTTDERRIATKPKLTYTSNPTPGKQRYGLQPGLQAPVKKNKPDRFQVLQGEDGSLPHLNTTIGREKASAIYPDFVMKDQNRVETSTEFYGGAGKRTGGTESYIRSFTEPFQQFMKLTTEGRPAPGGPVRGMQSVNSGPEAYSTMTHRDESTHVNYRGFEVPLFGRGGQTPTAALRGSVKYDEPVGQSVQIDRVTVPGLLDAFASNPYTKSLQSSA